MSLVSPNFCEALDSGRQGHIPFTEDIRTFRFGNDLAIDFDRYNPLDQMIRVGERIRIK